MNGIKTLDSAGLLHISVSHSYSMHLPEGWRLVSHDIIHEKGDSSLLIQSAPINSEETSLSKNSFSSRAAIAVLYWRSEI